MMGRFHCAAILASALALSGCETYSDVAFSGETHANELLRQDTLKTMSLFISAAGCDSIDHVDSEVLFYEPSRGEAGHIWGREGWMVTGCSRPFPFFVTFTEDGVGGTFMGVSRAGP